jgi:uncharacterized protein YkwD
MDDGQGPRLRGKRRRLLVAVVVLGLAATAAACAPPVSPGVSNCGAPGSPPAGVHQQIYNAINAQRGSPLAWNGQLYCLATDWSVRMGQAGAISHRDLNAVIRLPEFSGWRALGETVFAGPAGMDGNSIVAYWMASPSHAAIIRSASYHSVGIGLHYSGGYVWVTANFGG